MVKIQRFWVQRFKGSHVLDFFTRNPPEAGKPLNVEPVNL